MLCVYASAGMILVWGKKKRMKNCFSSRSFSVDVVGHCITLCRNYCRRGPRAFPEPHLVQRLKRQILRIELFKSAGVMSIWPYVFMRASVRWTLLGDLVWLSLCVAEPEGVFPPEVVVLNSTAVRVLWTAPLVPNGAVTQYSVYLDGRLYESASNGTGSLEVGGLLPFTVHSIQVWPSI